MLFKNNCDQQAAYYKAGDTDSMIAHLSLHTIIHPYCLFSLLSPRLFDLIIPPLSMSESFDSSFQRILYSFLVIWIEATPYLLSSDHRLF